MSNLEDVTRLPEDFDSRVSLFPLPELVVFPHAMQPLHIFEPRYCEMLAESLATNQLIAMSTLTGGINTQSAANPPIASTVCIGKIISHTEVETDRHNVLLVGIRRARIVQEVNANRSFRIAEVQVCDDYYSPSKAFGRSELKQDLLQAFANIIPSSSTVQQNLHELMAGQMSLGPITDIVAYTLPFRAESKLKLLAEPDVDARAEMLIELFAAEAIELTSLSMEEQSIEFDQGEGPRDFPPPFSLN